MRFANRRLTDHQWERLTWAVAAVAVFLAGLRVYPALGITPGAILGAVLAPVWLPSLSSFRGARLLAAVGGLALTAGLVLALVAPDRFTVRPLTFGFDATLIFGLLLEFGLLIWARTILPTHILGALYGLGLILSAMLKSSFPTENPWKFMLDIPVAILALSVVYHQNRWWGVTLLAVLAAYSATHDSRASMTVFLLSAVLVALQALPAGWFRRKSWPAMAGQLIVFGTVAYFGLGELMLSGALGSDIQERSRSQIDLSGSIIAGGRPEMFATIALMRYWPFGFGFGVTLDATAIQVAKQGMAQLNYKPDNGYVERFMFGDGITLHSVVGDLWARCGPMGLAFSVLVLWHAVRGMADRLNMQRLTALEATLVTATLWDLAFAPLYAACPTLILSLALILAPDREPLADNAFRANSGRKVGLAFSSQKVALR